ncbi:MAG: phosphotransferase [Actinophytocola sp.]|uniref:phosphotransferase family protein n=1 Tax=Actinophytocola sp. TaxID=1872138 RepID=UPI00132818FB|nr:phosphotransferase [Actinophytocola sp.]
MERMHAAMREFPGSLGVAGPRGDLSRVLAALERERLLDPGGRGGCWRAEGDRLGALMSALPAQALHGDAHPGNVLVTPAGLVWNDFEYAWHGPVAWDYACMAATGRPGAWAAAVEGRIDPAELAVCRDFRELFVAGWFQLLAHRFPHRAGEASEVLASTLPPTS